MLGVTAATVGLAPRAIGPVVRSRRVSDVNLRSAAHPAERIGAAPAASLQVKFKICELYRRILDSHPVEKGAAGPAPESPAEAVGSGGIALHKSIRTGGQGADAEVVVALLAVAAVEERLLAEGLEGQPAVAADLADRLQAAALLHADAASALPDGDGRAHEMARSHPTHPAVARIVDGNRHPAVVLVALAASLIFGRQSKVLDRHAAHKAGADAGLDISPAPTAVKRLRQRHIHFYRTLVGAQHAAVEMKVKVARLPGGQVIVGIEAQPVGTQSLDPLLSGRTGNQNIVTRLQAVTLGKRNTD